MPRSGRERLLDILESIRRIDEYTPGLTGEHSEVYLDAILYNFIVVGEASRNVPQDLQALAPETDWRAQWG